MQNLPKLPFSRFQAFSLALLVSLVAWTPDFMASAAEITVVQPEFLVNTSRTIGRQSHPTIAMNGDGLIFMTWATESTTVEDIKGRAYFSDGLPWTREFPVNLVVREFSQNSPDVETNGTDRWVVVWTSKEGVEEHKTYGKLYSSSNTRQQFEFSVDGDVFGP